MLLVAVLLLVGCPLTDGSKVIKVMAMSLQSLQPSSNAGPCQNVSEPSCSGGFASVNAVMRNEGRNADGTVKIGALQALSQLILTHPEWIGVNYILYKRGSFDAVAMHRGDLAVSTRFWKAIKTIASEPLPLIHTNQKTDAFNMRAFLDYSYIKEFPGVPGMKLAYLVCYPSTYVSVVMPRESVVKYIDTIRKALGVTNVVLSLLDKVVPGDLDFYTKSGVVDVILFHGSEAPDSLLSNATSRLVQGTWHIEAVAYRRRVDTLTMTVDPEANFRVTRAEIRSVSTGVELPSRYMDKEYAEDMQIVQQHINLAQEHDPELGISVAPMPHAFYAYDNGTTMAPCRYEECHLGTFMVDAMHAGYPQGEIVMLNGGNLFEGWDRGTVRTSHLQRALPYQNTLCILNMTAVGIWRALEHSVAALDQSGGIDPSNSGKDNGEQFLQVKGMRYFFNPAHAKGKRITRIEIPDGENGWQPINPKREYRVVTTNWVCMGGDGHAFVASSGTAEITGLDQWSLAARRLQELSPYTPAVHGVIGIDQGAPSLALGKAPGDCGERGVFNPIYEVCDLCPEGYYNPSPGKECVLIPLPPPPPPSLLLPVVVPVVLGSALMVAIGVKLWLVRLNRRKEELVKHAPRKGPMTFVFTDIMSSTQLWGLFPEDMNRAMDQHHKIVRQLIHANQGYEVKTIGDAFMVAFRKTIDAVKFACELQSDLNDAVWPEAILQHPASRKEGDAFNGLRVRIGINIGEAVVKQTPQGGFDYEGPVVNVCARVADSGNGGQIVITEAVYEAIEGEELDMEVQFLGSFNFKGVDHPVTCLQVLPDHLTERKFSGLRHVQPVPDQDGSDDTSDLSGMKKDEVQAVQILRKHFGIYSEGIPLHKVCSLLARCIEQGLVSERKALYTIFSLRPETYEPTPSRRGSATSTQDTTTVLPTNLVIRWNTFVSLIRALPLGCASAMAGYADGEYAPSNHSLSLHTAV